MHDIKSCTINIHTHLSLSCCDNIFSLCLRKNSTSATKLINTNRTRKPKAIATASYIKLLDIAELEVSPEEIELEVSSIDTVTDDIVILIVGKLEVGTDVRAGSR